VYVYSLAEYYDIPQLKRLALEKLLSRHDMQGEWPAEGLMIALHLAANLLPEGDVLHELLCAAAVEHAAALVRHPRFNKLMRDGGAFAENFTRALVAQRSRELATQRQQLDAAQRAYAAEVAAMLDRERATHAAATMTMRAQLEEGNRSLATATASLRAQLDERNLQHAAEADALRASHAQKEKKRAAEAQSLRAQLSDAQQKLAAERTLRHRAENARRELVDGIRALVPADGGATSRRRGGTAARTQG
jgi:hypothetical protein